MALVFSKNYVSELSEENPEKRFKTTPEFARVSKIEHIVPEENASGVVFDDEASFIDALKAFSRGEIAVFSSSGINGSAKPEFYDQSLAHALSQLREKGYFKKNMDQEGLHANCFDTLVEGLVVEGKYILKLQYGIGGEIEEDLARKKQGLLSLQNASVQLEFEPLNRWWLKFDLYQMLKPLGVTEAVVQDIVAKMCDGKTMARRYPLAIDFQGQTVMLSINIFANRLVRRNAHRWVKAEGSEATFCAWEHANGDIVGDVPKLQFRFAMRERQKGLTPLQNYQLSHICDSSELELIHEVRQFFINHLETLQSEYKSF